MHEEEELKFKDKLELRGYDERLNYVLSRHYNEVLVSMSPGIM